MTVGELKKALENITDDVEVVIKNDEWGQCPIEYVKHTEHQSANRFVVEIY